MCPRCLKRGKTWDGDDPKCAFENGVFSHENWNCATMNALRELAEENAVWNNDSNAAIIPNKEDGGFIALAWYKRRGKTSTAFIFDDDVYPRPLTLEYAENTLGSR